MDAGSLRLDLEHAVDIFGTIQQHLDSVLGQPRCVRTAECFSLRMYLISTLLALIAWHAWAASISTATLSGTAETVAAHGTLQAQGRSTGLDRQRHDRVRAAGR